MCSEPKLNALFIRRSGSRANLWAMRMLLVLLAFSGIAGLPGDIPVRAESDRQLAQNAADAGEVKPLSEVLHTVKASVPGQVLDAPATIRRSYSLPGRTAVTFGDFVRAAARASGERVRLVPIPPVVALAVAGLLERVMPVPRIRREQIERLLEDKDFDWDAAARDFGYDPSGIETGLALEVARLRERGAA